MGAVFGKYQLIAQLGEGGMAQVFLAAVAGPRGSGFRKLVVVKRLRSSYEEDPEFITMLVDEARIAARLNHPNVVQTHEVGEVDGKYFLAMEYLDGHSLNRIMNRSRAKAKKSGAGGDGLFSKEMGYVALCDVLAGLHHAHELKEYDGTSLDIVHRDITPQNIFVTYEGQVKILDFGIAKAAGRGSETRHGVIKGKVRYMAPEQSVGNDVDRRADIYSVGVLLWEIATGDRRWKDESEVTIVRALISGEAFLPPSEVNPSVPPEIDAICKKALATQREDRYATAEEFRKDLHDFLVSSNKLVEARAKLGPTVAELFSDIRAELSANIEKQLSTVTQSGSEVTPMMLTVHGDGDRSYSSSRRQLPSSLAPRKSRAGLFAGVAAITVAAAVGITLQQRSASRADDDTSNTTGALAPSATSAATSDQVSVNITATPPTAKISIDGVPVSAPYEAKHDRSTTAHTVTIEAPGFEPQTKTIVYDRNLSLSVALNKAAAPEPTPSPAPAPAPRPFARYQPPAAKAATSEVAPAPTPTPVPTPVATPEKSKPKRDIDRNSPFATGTSTVKSIDKGNPFEN